MQLPNSIADLDPRCVRDMFAEFISRDSEYDWSAGIPRLIPRAMDATYIATSLSVTIPTAQKILGKLKREGWLEGDSPRPTHAGMALAQHSDRPRISRADAQAILHRVLDWVEVVNADTNARVRVGVVELYGSLARDEPTVGDIDLVITFTTLDLGDDLQPEDLERENELGAELAGISEYISAASEFDKLAMPNANYRTIYPK